MIKYHTVPVILNKTNHMLTFSNLYRAKKSSQSLTELQLKKKEERVSFCFEGNPLTPAVLSAETLCVVQTKCSSGPNMRFSIQPHFKSCFSSQNKFRKSLCHTPEITCDTQYAGQVIRCYVMLSVFPGNYKHAALNLWQEMYTNNLNQSLQCTKTQTYVIQIFGCSIWS